MKKYVIVGGGHRGTTVYAVPIVKNYAVKSEAVLNKLKYELSSTIPATILKTYSDFTQYIDRDSASKLELPVKW